MKKLTILITIALAFTFCSSNEKVKKRYAVTDDGKIVELKSSNTKLKNQKESKVKLKSRSFKEKKKEKGYKSIKVGTYSKLLDDKGKQIGQLHQITKTEQHAKFDKNNDGIPEKIVILKNNKISEILFDENEDKKIDTIIKFNNNVKEKVLLYDQNSNKLRSVSHLINDEVLFVDLIDKNKRVYFNEDNSINKIIELDKDTEKDKMIAERKKLIADRKKDKTPESNEINEMK